MLEEAHEDWGGRQGWEAQDASNDSWVEVKEMRLHEQEGIQVMRKIAGKLGNETFRSGGMEKCVNVIHPKSQALLNKISLYSPELSMPLIKAKIAKRMHANYSEIIHSALFCVNEMNANLWSVLEGEANSTATPTPPSALLTLWCEKPITSLHQQLIPHYCRDEFGRANMNGFFALENERC